MDRMLITGHSLRAGLCGAKPYTSPLKLQKSPNMDLYASWQTLHTGHVKTVRLWDLSLTNTELYWLVGMISISSAAKM